MINKKIKNICISIFVVIIAIFVIISFFFAQPSIKKVYGAEQDVIFNAVLHDAKIKGYSHKATIDEDFEDDKVKVILNYRYSKVNGEVNIKDFYSKSSTVKFKSVTDNFRVADETTERENFRQILSLELQEKSKENVLQAIKELEKLDSVLVAQLRFMGAC